MLGRSSQRSANADAHAAEHPISLDCEERTCWSNRRYSGASGWLLQGLVSTLDHPERVRHSHQHYFDHRINQYRRKCDTREVVLKRDGTNVVQSSSCAATSGTWYSPYDGATWTTASDVDID